ncbi:MAG: septation protein A [Pseudomonadota bacterium]
MNGSDTMEARRQNGFIKFALEMGPLITFFVINNRAVAWDLGRLPLLSGFDETNLPIMAATLAFMVATALALTISLTLYKHLPVMPLLSGVIVLIFGGLTLYLQDELFIKLKPTIVNLLFAGTLLGGLYILKRPLLQLVFDSVFQLDDEGWWKLSFRWAMFFLFLAALNEFVWRTFSTDFWVSFKVFGVMPLTIAFTLSQFPLIYRHAVDDEDGDDGKKDKQVDKASA